MREIQFREALREAMVEEMRNDGTIYLMGEEVAEYNGAYKASKGMLAEFGEGHNLSVAFNEIKNVLRCLRAKVLRLTVTVHD